jgi:SHS2 domain-containing protein
MPYKFLEDVAIADIAFVASGSSLKELFESAAMAMFVQTADLNTIDEKEKRTFKLESDSVEKLLYEFLSEIVFLKDADGIIFKKVDVEIKEIILKGVDSSAKQSFMLRAALWGEKINYDKHELKNDIKAVTKHLYEVKQEGKKWIAKIIVDI